MRLTKEYKWEFYRVVEGLYSILPPEKIRHRCGVNYESKIFPDLKEELEKLNVDTEKFPIFHMDTLSQTEQVVAMLNRKWKDFIEKGIKNGV